MKLPIFRLTVLVLMVSLCACSPKYNWREVRGSEAQYSALLPAKPTEVARDIDINGVSLHLQMQGADVGGVNFAIGSAKLADPAQAALVIAGMQQGMVKNIHGEVTRQTTLDIHGQITEIEAKGHLRNGTPVKLVGRFMVRGPWAIQLIAMGPDNALTDDALEMFMGSFKTE